MYYLDPTNLYEDLVHFLILADVIKFKDDFSIMESKKIKELHHDVKYIPSLSGKLKTIYIPCVSGGYQVIFK